MPCCPTTALPPLDTMAGDALGARVPGRSRCTAPDCAGLCPVRGADRNDRPTAGTAGLGDHRPPLGRPGRPAPGVRGKKEEDDARPQA